MCASERPATRGNVYRSLTVQVALVGTMTAAFFSNRLYGESIYWMCALAYSLHRIQSTELEKIDPSWSTTEPVPAVAAVMPPSMVARSRA